ncbi:hypothetical protein Rhsp01_12090 [Rhizobium sp. NBRC 114257]|uniref:Uncharacterized protein n=1 Tax=Rhizobium dioscoreae TaxID=2653122 RepID=A0ABQ0YWA2_9HYPH|nr:hypothetical protein RsS93_01160 [Rhizobium dioscoreae]GLU80033.1 hypothetical protein Rhsp01_12090 [Rhizobium sp. NBRC 114257]
MRRAVVAEATNPALDNAPKAWPLLGGAFFIWGSFGKIHRPEIFDLRTSKIAVRVSAGGTHETDRA